MSIKRPVQASPAPLPTTGISTCVLKRAVSEGDLCLFRRHGFEFLDISFGPNENEMKIYRAGLKNTGMRLWSMHGLDRLDINIGNSLPANRNQMAEQLRRAMEIVAELGGRCLVVHPGTLISRPDGGMDQHQRSLETLLAVVPDARRAGIVLCLENMPTGIWGDKPEALAALLTALPADCVGACLDSGHALEAGNLAQMLTVMGQRLCMTHLHDNSGAPGEDKHMAPGRGNVDWPRVIERLRTGYPYPWNFEVLPAPNDTIEQTIAGIREWVVTCLGNRTPLFTRGAEE